MPKKSEWNLDDLIPFYSPKLVEVDDWKLGLCGYFMKASIFLLIAVYLMWYEGAHLKVVNEKGYSKSRLWHPTKHRENPTLPTTRADWKKMADLPYCGQSASGSGKPQCKMMDCFALSPGAAVPAAYLIPTKIGVVRQERGCTPSAASDYACEGGQLWKTGSGAGAKEEFYVSQIEDWTLHILHVVGGKANNYITRNPQGFLVYQAPPVSVAGGASLLQLSALASAQSSAKAVGSHATRVSSPQPLSAVERRASEEQALLERRAEKAVAAFDGSGDGGLSEEELLALLSATYVDEADVLPARKAGAEDSLRSGLHGALLQLQSEEDVAAAATTTPIPAYVQTRPRLPGAPPQGLQVPMGREEPQLEDYWSVYYDDTRSELVLSVADLLKLAHVEGAAFLDAASPADLDGKDGTVRDSGAVLRLDIVYTNRAHWDFFGQTPVHYQVSAHVQKKVKSAPHSFVMADKKNDTHREIQNIKGLLVKVNVDAQIRVFDITSLVTVATAAAALIVAAVWITDFLMLHVPIFSFKPERVYYVKYQPWIDEDTDNGMDDSTMDLENVWPDLLSKVSQPGKERDLTNEEVVSILLMLDKRVSRLDAFTLEWMTDKDDWRHAQQKKFAVDYVVNARREREADILSPLDEPSAPT
eukprot:TRINITY_DN70653_c0_g2_i1.p1 TRINITY_DN70653_c0_g2~~TRINITY_DN70653_c0_g2_i1.p1  ORF type:complete len:644 (-),score=146.71 TRINITY_DN70653_c0_g2_i1:37-1968(-)